MKEEERLILSLSRFDTYYGLINSKSAFYAGFITFLCGSIITILTQNSLFEGLKDNNEICLTLMISLFLGLINLFIIIIANVPYKDSNMESVIYFESISAMNKGRFLEESENIKEDKVLMDLRNQAYCLSKGLSKKFNSLRWVSLLLIFQIIFLVPFIFNLLK
ncbi:Pycsar system effector family protein [Wenyingzhuangia sp. IMCC45574]